MPLARSTAGKIWVSEPAWVVATLAQGLLPFVTGDAIHVDGGLHILA